MTEIIKKIIGEYKWLAIAIILAVLVSLFLVAILIERRSIQLYIGGLLAAYLVYMAIDNQYFPLFSSIHENSTKNEILCRGGLIMIYFLFMVILIIQELLRF